MDEVEGLQDRLSREVFARTKSPRKAAGRALGTLVEIIAYYVLLSWGLRDSISIETPVGEYGSKDITHNVDYSLHPALENYTFAFSQNKAISCKDIQSRLRNVGIEINAIASKNLLSKNGTLKNGCKISNDTDYRWVANLNGDKVTVTKQRAMPFMLIECKRVGRDAKGNAGPQAIEKAKQGSYVARTVSSLQKIWDNNGNSLGVIYDDANRPTVGDYDTMVSRTIKTDNLKTLSRFIMSVGVVSDHGNWLTSGKPNKELRVLQQSYDWLIFLTDQGLACFVEKVIMSGRYPAIQNAFYSSHAEKNGKNQFTKSNMLYDAHMEMLCYFIKNKTRVEAWLDVMSPHNRPLSVLKRQIGDLRGKAWER